MKTYDLATAFSNIPYGRHPQDGANSGERFRQDRLLPWLRQALANDETVEIDLDGLPLGVGSAFLEESFGGLVRNGLFSRDDILKTLRIKSDNEPSYIEEILDYIRLAEGPEIPGKHDFFTAWAQDNHDTGKGVARELLLLKVTEALHEAMERSSFTLEELAFKSGKSQGKINQMLSGKADVSLQELAELAFVMGFEIDIVLRDKD